MHTIIIGQGLTNEYLSTDSKFQTSRFHVGGQEASRLLGNGTTAYDGALTVFLQQAASASIKDEKLSVLLFRNTEYEAKNTASKISSPIEKDFYGHRGDHFIEPLTRETLSGAEIVDIPHQMFPLENFRKIIENVTGIDPVLQSSDKDNCRFFLVGSHTEKSILNTALLLKNVLGYQEVATCTHLIGSVSHSAHFSTIQHNLLSANVNVFTDLNETVEYLKLDPAPFTDFKKLSCEIQLETKYFSKPLGAVEQKVIEFLCMHWTKTKLKKMSGGFSGSGLFLANGWKDSSSTEPMVLKLDNFMQMRKEIQGYSMVKDFLGKHLPAFNDPVTIGDYTGISMELATMEGSPETMHDFFDSVQTEDDMKKFLSRFTRVLDLMKTKLYQNTLKTKMVAPYRNLGLNSERRQKRLNDNAGIILNYAKQDSVDDVGIDIDMVKNAFNLIVKNEDAIESTVCLTHGDFNYQNIICDNADNIWIIDWINCDLQPVEKDFAKLENDMKYVISKDFDYDELARLRTLEDYLLSHQLPGTIKNLPDTLKFVKWDLRFRKIFEGVRRIRETCFSINYKEDWIIYKVALLRYALQTLTFDKRRGIGDCDAPQLLHVLYSFQVLVLQLVVDDFHLKIRGERPASYPQRFRILIDDSLWRVEPDDYTPPYHVDKLVLENDFSIKSDGWADPEDFSKLKDRTPFEALKKLDKEGRPLNPRGRTGIAGRGLLGKWGPNNIVTILFTRETNAEVNLECLFEVSDDSDTLSLPSKFVKNGQSPESTIQQKLGSMFYSNLDTKDGELILNGYSYDKRQTDHAWIENHVFHFHENLKTVQGSALKDRCCKWIPIQVETINNLPSNQSFQLREVLKGLISKENFNETYLKSLLSQTGS